MWEQAGQIAARKFANTEAIRQFKRAIELLGSLPDNEAKKSHELALQINLAPVYMAAKGFGAPEVETAYSRARDLAVILKDKSRLFTALWGLWLFNLMQPKGGAAQSLSDELLALGAENADSNHILQAHHASWSTHFFLGGFERTREHAAQGAALYDVSEHRSHRFIYGGHDPGVCSGNFGGLSDFVLGFPDRALVRMREGLGLAETLNHPLSLLLVETFVAVLHLLRGEAQLARKMLDHAVTLASEKSISRSLWADFLSGWVLRLADGPKEGLPKMLRDIDTVGGAGQEAFRPYYLGVLAETCGAADRIEDGLEYADKALGLSLTLNSKWCLAELYRIKGELLLARGGSLAVVEPCFDTAIAIACEQRARSWELRATMSVARLWHSQGKVAEARDRLAGVYNMFTEGFSTADLREAKALLDKLANVKNP
jgi:predicted ATPase